MLSVSVLNLGVYSDQKVCDTIAQNKQEFLERNLMTKKVVTFEYEKETKNSVRYKEVPDEGTAPIVGSLYVQKWFAGNSKMIEVTIEKKD